MKNLILLALMLGLAWVGYSNYQGGDLSSASVEQAHFAAPSTPVATPPAAEFKCDGRTQCSQMTSCAEAEYFLAHCPNTRMDGNRDGEPCEQQWCK